MPVMIQEFAELTFSGPSFQDPGLEIDVLAELIEYKKLLVATAEELWRGTHPDRPRLHWGFKAEIRLRVDSILPGSVRVPLKREINYPDGEFQLDVHDEVNEAAQLIDAVIDAVGAETALPSNFPKNVIPLFKDFGGRLNEGDAIVTRSSGRAQGARYTSESRRRLMNWTDRTYADRTTIEGEVRAADLDGCRFALKTGSTRVEGIKFSPQDEEVITEALREHSTCRVRVTGVGSFDKETGVLSKIVQLEALEVLTASEKPYDDSVPPVWQRVVEIGRQVPRDDWDALPADMSVNLDKYLYGGSEGHK